MFFIQLSSDGKSITVQTTDDQVVTVNFHEQIDSSVNGWIEVHGFAKGKGVVTGDSYYILPSSITDNFGKPYFILNCIIIIYYILELLLFFRKTTI